MIKKRIETNEGNQYLIGFKEIGSYKDGIECHVLKKALFGYKSIFNKLYIKGASPNYKQIAALTISDYEQDQKQKLDLMKVWN